MKRKARRSSSQTNKRAKLINSATKVAKSFQFMISKIILTAAIIATMLATLCVTASELANAGHGE